MGDAAADRLSGLPDGILLSILSLLSPKEAAATSILSKTWRDRNLWRYVTVLDFDGSENAPFSGGHKKWSAIEYKRSWYIELVNRVLAFHESPTIDEFRVVFDLDRTSNHHIDKWVEFAFSKGLKKLELTVRCRILDHFLPSGCYALTKRWFRDTIAHRRPAGSSMKLLRHLCVRYVHVSGSVVQQFLCFCPLLEHLQIKRSRPLMKLKVGGDHGLSLVLRLRSLEIIDCFELECLDICVPNLVSFKFKGPNLRLKLEDVSNLTHVNVYPHCRGEISCCPVHMFSPLSSCYDQLQSLTFYVDPGSEHLMRFPEFLEFSHLHCLSLHVRGPFDGCALRLTDLMHTSPFLKELIVEIMSPFNMSFYF